MTQPKTVITGFLIGVSAESDELRQTQELLESIPDGLADRFNSCLANLCATDFLKFIEPPAGLASVADNCIARLHVCGMFELCSAALRAANGYSA